MPETVELTDRYRKILSILVQEYIERGEPVSSLQLTRHRRLRLSSATVRNILAKLEGWGYLHQPHSSSGRVPTDLGYRCYVDGLLEERRPRGSRTMETRLSLAGSADDVLSSVPHELSRASHCVGFALARLTETTAFDQIQFVPIGAQKVLVVVVSTDGHFSQKAIDIGEPVNIDDLRRAAKYLNTEFSGLPLVDVRDAIVEQLNEERLLYDTLLARALRLAQATFEDIADHNELMIQGVWSLLDESRDADEQLSRAALRAMLELIEEKSRLIRLLSKYIDGAGLMVVIGTEHTSPDLKPFSLVTATYSEGHRAGTIGILGPTRMRYSRAIAAVDGAAGALTRLLPRANHDVGA